MAQVENYDRSRVQRAPLSQGRQQQLPDNGAGRLFDTMTQIGNDQMRREQELQDENDAAAATDAFTRANDEIREYLYNQETGALNRQGEHALNLPQESQEFFDKVRRRHSEALSNNSQRKAFQSLLSRKREATLNTVYRHSAGQRQVYRANLAKASAEGAINDAILGYQDPAQVQQAKTTGEDAIRANLLGQGDEVVSQALGEFRDKLHAGVIERMVATDPDAAANYYTENMGQISAELRGNIEGEIALSQFQDVLQLGVEAGEQVLATFASEPTEHMTGSEHRAMVRTMTAMLNAEYSRIRRTTEAETAALKAWKSRTKRAAQDLEYSLWRGHLPENAGDILQAAEQLGDEAVLEELNAAVGAQRALAAFSTMPPEQRLETLSELNGVKNKTADQLRVMEAMQKRQSELDKLLKDDPIQYGIETGLAEDVPAMDYGDGLADALAARVEIAERVTAQTGQPVGAFSQADAKLFSRAMRQLPAAGQVSMIGEITNQLGPDIAQATFGDISSKQGGMFAAAGVMYSRGLTEGAERVLDGMEQRKLNNLTAPKPTDMAPDLEGVYAVYGQMGEDGVRVVEAIKNVYASLAADNGSINGIYDSALMEKAIAQTTGGIIDMGDYYIEAPRPDMDADDVDNMLSELRPNDIEAMGGVYGMRPDQVTDLFQSDALRLQSLGGGLYHVIRDNGQLLASDPETPFILDLGNRRTPYTWGDAMGNAIRGAFE